MTLAMERAYPSASQQIDGEHEVIVGHDHAASIAQVRNDLAAKAQNDYLCFLDADDELRPGYLRAMQRVALLHRGGERLFMPKTTYVRNGKASPARFLREKNLQDDNWLILGTVLSRRLFEEVGGFGDYPHGFEDWSLWAKCWRAGATIQPVPGATYIAHVNPNSKHRLGWKHRAWQVETHNKVRRELFPELYE